MKLGLLNFTAADLTIHGEVCDLAPSKPSTQTDPHTDIAPLIRKLVARPNAEIDLLITKLQEAKDYLQSEWERLEQKTASYVRLTHLASETATIILDSMSQWHPSRIHQKSTASETTAVSSDNEIGGSSKGDEPQSAERVQTQSCGTDAEDNPEPNGCV
jgi:hypothetical protein